MSRESVLGRVRQAVDSGKAYRVAIGPIPENVGYVGAQGDLAEALATEIRAVGGTTFVVPDAQAARDKLAELLDELRPQSVIGWEHALLDRVGVLSMLQERRIPLWTHQRLHALPWSEQRSNALAADLAISSVDWAIAETGTLVVRARNGRERIASLIAPVHIALVESSQIVPDLLDVFAALHAEGLDQLPSNLALITGPSKTGDIELQLTTGVHGPGTWITVILKD